MSMSPLFIFYNWGVVHTWMSGGQRTTCGIGFFSIVWVPGIRLKLSDLTASDSPTESSGLPRALFSKRQVYLFNCCLGWPQIPDPPAS